MTRGLTILVTVLCCVSGCISKSEQPPSDSTVGGTVAAPDTRSASSAGESQAVEQADEPQLVRTTPKPKPAAPTARKRGAEIISFDDLIIGLEPDVRFRPFMMQDKPAAELIGKRVVVGGYMSPTDRMTGITDFILLRNLECKFGPGGQADHLVHVFMQEDAAVDFTDKVVYVEGTLKLNPFHSPDGFATWSIYDLQGVGASTTPPRRVR